jgi:hypothetical protein
MGVGGIRLLVRDEIEKPVGSFRLAGQRHHQEKCGAESLMA